MLAARAGLGRDALARRADDRAAAASLPPAAPPLGAAAATSRRRRRVAPRAAAEPAATSAAAPAVHTPSQAPPPEVTYPVTLQVLEVTRSVTLLRAACDARPPGVQFGQRRGTTTNCYLLRNGVGEPEVRRFWV
jgi:hypothetical protein